MDEGSIILDYWTPPGTSLTDTDAMLNGLEKVLLTIPDVRDLLAAHRHAARLLHHGAEPRRLRHPPEAARASGATSRT